jgi:hypothetical protein
MFSVEPMLAEANLMWYAIPLVVSISLVYSATHHERLRPILAHAVRLGLMIVGFMVAIMNVLAIIGWRL